MVLLWVRPTQTSKHFGGCWDRSALGHCMTCPGGWSSLHVSALPAFRPSRAASLVTSPHGAIRFECWLSAVGEGISGVAGLGRSDPARALRDQGQPPAHPGCARGGPGLERRCRRPKPVRGLTARRLAPFTAGPDGPRPRRDLRDTGRSRRSKKRRASNRAPTARRTTGPSTSGPNTVRSHPSPIGWS